MKIGNIVSVSNLSVLDEFNVVKSMDDIIHGLPTLIIGWDTIKELYGDDINILERRVDDITFWTFQKKERRDIHEEDLVKFIEFTYNHLLTSVEYIFVDPIQMKKGAIKKIIKKILSSKDIITLELGDMFYLYTQKYIFGIDFKLLRFMEINTNKIYTKINQISDVFLRGNDIIIEYSGYLEKLNNEAKYIPLLYSLKNE